MIFPSENPGSSPSPHRGAAMVFTKGQIYWVEHPRFGTIKARLALGSTKSLMFFLEQEIGVPFAGGGEGPFANAGMMVTTMLPITNEDGIFTCFMTGQDHWKIYDQEPAVKLPTK